MGEALINNLSSILLGVAAVISASAALVSVVGNRTAIAKTNAKLDAVGVKVDGGMTALQTALADIAKTAAAATANRAIRSTDRTS